MIGYVTLGTKDLKKSAAFYDKIAPKWASDASWNPTPSLPGDRPTAAPGWV